MQMKFNVKPRTAKLAQDWEHKYDIPSLTKQAQGIQVQDRVQYFHDALPRMPKGTTTQQKGAYYEL